MLCRPKRMYLGVVKEDMREKMKCLTEVYGESVEQFLMVKPEDEEDGYLCDKRMIRNTHLRRQSIYCGDKHRMCL